MTKIRVAAIVIGVSYKTIYNWIEDGSLKLAHPGYVHLDDVESVHLEKQKQKSARAKDNSRQFLRDEQGRFRLLSGKLNNKTAKRIN